MSEQDRRQFTASVHHGDGAISTIQDPRSFNNGGVGWVLTYGDAGSVRLVAASLLESYDYLLSPHINMTEATRRLRQMRARRAKLEAETIGRCTDIVIEEADRLSDCSVPYAAEIMQGRMDKLLAQPAESGATKCIACSQPLGDRQTYIPTAKGPMHPSCWERTGAKP